MKADSLGDRMKAYENVSRNYLMRRTPVIVRVDGRAFHTFTKNFSKPFDIFLSNAMVHGATSLAKEMQGFVAAYVQSDEATFFLQDYATIETEAWFNYNLNKIVSVSSAVMSVWFNFYISTYAIPNAIFDARAFNIPHDEVVNNFLWRAQDWKRNSLQMYARHFFTHKQMHGKNSEDLHNMLHSISKNWATDVAPRFRNGVFLINTSEGIKEKHDVLPTYTSIKAAIGL